MCTYLFLITENNFIQTFFRDFRCCVNLRVPKSKLMTIGWSIIIGSGGSRYKKGKEDQPQYFDLR